MRQKFSRLFIATLVALSFIPEVRAQRVLFSQDVDTSSVIPRNGPNRLFFTHWVVGLGVMPGPQEYGLQTNWYSTSVTAGGRSKVRFCNWNAVVMDYTLRIDRYSINEKRVKLYPLDPARHKRETLSLGNVSLAFCDRINFGRRGNSLGTFLDLGVYGDYVFHSANVYIDRYYDSNSPAGHEYKGKTKFTRLPYLEKTNYGFTARFGSRRGGVYAQWRWNELVKDTPVFNAPDLPKLIIGIEAYFW